MTDYTDDDMRALRDHVFGPRDTDTDDSDHRGNCVPKEGRNPPVRRLDARAQLLDFTKRLLDPEGYGATEAPLPE